MSTPTKGPWKCDTRSLVHAICCKPTRDGEHAEVAFVPVRATGPHMSGGSVAAQKRTPDELQANARLIAAAPELLVALSAMLANYLELKRVSLALARSDAPNWIGSPMTPDDDIHVIKARAAIAKATSQKEETEPNWDEIEKD